jgi:hypothetical protein
MGVSISSKRAEEESSLSEKVIVAALRRFVDDQYPEGTSLNCFDKESNLRKTLFDIITSKNFERFIIIFILLSSIQLALTNPLNDPNG